MEKNALTCSSPIKNQNQNCCRSAMSNLVFIDIRWEFKSTPEQYNLAVYYGSVNG